MVEGVKGLVKGLLQTLNHAQVNNGAASRRFGYVVTGLSCCLQARARDYVSPPSSFEVVAEKVLAHGNLIINP